MAATDAILAGALGADPARPLITYYDDSADGRVELSAATLNNWVAKTANLLQDEFDLEAGGSVAIALPAHWQTAAILLAGWSVGAVITSEPESADVVFCRPENRPDTAAEIVTCPLRPLGMPEPAAPGAIDYATATLAQPDAFVPYVSVPPDAAATPDRTGADVLAQARARGLQWGLDAGDRVLSTLAWTGYADWLDGLLAPLAAGASVVLSPEPIADRLPDRAGAEKVTASVGAGISGVRELLR